MKFALSMNSTSAAAAVTVSASAAAPNKINFVIVDPSLMKREAATSARER